jgi:cob(I)alamin adenosyltransferase
MKRSKIQEKEAEKNLLNVQKDLNEIMSLINSLDEIDEDYDVEKLEEKINNMEEEIDVKYKDLLSKDNLDSKK